VLKAAPWVRTSSPSARVCATVCLLGFRAALGFRCFSVSCFAPPPRPFLHFSVHLRSLHQHRPRRLSLGFCVEVFLPLIDFANGFSRRQSQARRSSRCLSRTARHRCLSSRTAFPRRRAVRGRISESSQRRRCLPYLGSRFTRRWFLSPVLQTLPVFRLLFLGLSPVRRVWGRSMARDA
jgi:hypothetical protein